jgi:FtsP/CotA-like multicopper oxidase with cupredoxin domain
MSDFSRRQLLQGSAALLALGSIPPVEARMSSARVVTPNGSTLPYTVDHGVKVFHLVAEPVRKEFTPGLWVNCWGYNGQSPGPTIEVTEGDHVRIYVTNRLPEVTSMHWHGVLLPNGQDGVAGLTQPAIQPGETYVYEFTLRQHGTLMYHPHADEMTQIALGMQGFFIIHPRHDEAPVDHDFAIFLNEWRINAGTATPVAFEMTDFNYFTFNSRVYPGTAPLVVRRGDRVRIRLANLSMDSHPIHLHGHIFRITGTPGGRIPAVAQMPEATVNVPVGTTRDIEFVADNPGDWPFHCHKSHHTMNGMVHDLPNLLGVPQQDSEVQKVLPGTMAPMGESGMAQMNDMQSPNSGMKMAMPGNTVAMAAASGPHGNIEMGGMFTLLKVRDHGSDSTWYHPPAGTVARRVATPSHLVYTCPMHPEVRSPAPGHCPKCGMTLIKKGL